MQKMMKQLSGGKGRMAKQLMKWGAENRFSVDGRPLDA